MSETRAWEQRSRESAKAFVAFCLYRDAGASRSLRSVVDVTGSKLGQISGWSAKWEWVSRARAYDVHLDAIAQAEREAAEKAEAQKWAERRALQREQEHAIAQQLMDRARQMMAHPLTFEKTEQDGKVVFIHPSKWQLRDVPAFLETASKLARLAAEMETERRTLQGPGGGDIGVSHTHTVIDPAKLALLSDDELAILERVFGLLWPDGENADTGRTGAP